MQMHLIFALMKCAKPRVRSKIRQKKAGSKLPTQNTAARFNETNVAIIAKDQALALDDNRHHQIAPISVATVMAG